MGQRRKSSKDVEVELARKQCARERRIELLHIQPRKRPLRRYDNQRPHRALDELPPVPFAMAHREYKLTGSSPLATGNHRAANSSDYAVRAH